MVYFLLLQLTHKDSILYYKAVKIMINIHKFIKVMSNVIVCYYNLLDLAIIMEVFSDVVICYHNLPHLIIIDSDAFYLLEICHCYAIFQILDAIFLLRFICKPAALLKGQIAASGAYFQAFTILNLDN